MKPQFQASPASSRLAVVLPKSRMAPFVAKPIAAARSTVFRHGPGVAGAGAVLGAALVLGAFVWFFISTQQIMGGPFFHRGSIGVIAFMLPVCGWVAWRGFWMIRTEELEVGERVVIRDRYLWGIATRAECGRDEVLIELHRGAGTAPRGRFGFAIVAWVREVPFVLAIVSEREAESARRRLAEAIRLEVEWSSVEVELF